MEVWVLTYEHKYGNDVSVYSTQEKAWASAKEIVKSYMDEYNEFCGDEGDEEEGIPPTPAPDFEEVWARWTDVTGEGFEVVCCTVDPTD